MSGSLWSRPRPSAICDASTTTQRGYLYDEVAEEYTSPAYPPVPTVADTTEYVEHRLHQAGATKPLLGAGALTILHEATRGQLRDIDRIATNAMRLAARRKQSLVDRDLLEKVLERDQEPRAPP